MNITLWDGPPGCYCIQSEDGATLLIQTEGDCARIASAFGWKPCNECNVTDGTIDCEHCSSDDMLAKARRFLDQSVWETVEDPGFFS